MMHDAHDHNYIPIKIVEYPVPSMKQAANAIAQIGAPRSGHWMFAQQRKGRVKSQEVAVGDFDTKSIDAVNPYIPQVCTRRRTKVKLSHLLPDIRPLSLAAHLPGAD